MKNIKFSIALAILPIVFNNCHTYRNMTNETEALFRNNWRLTELNGQAIPDSVQTSFKFTPGKISGSTGCNQLSAEFTAGSKQTIKFSPEAISTKMACEENASTREKNFLDALTKTDNWDLESGELRLATGRTTLLKFRSL